MLRFKRKSGQGIVVADRTLVIVDGAGGSAKVAVAAPESVEVDRLEVWLSKLAERDASGAAEVLQQSTARELAPLFRSGRIHQLMEVRS